MKLIKGEIVSNERIGNNLYKTTIFSPYITKNAVPGQFINIKCCSDNTVDPLLRRPFSIHDVEYDFKVFSIMYEVKGNGTHFLSKLNAADVIDFVGPLGNGININKIENDDFLLIGGGIGIAPLYFFAKVLLAENKNVFFAAGFKDGNFLLFDKMLERLKINYEIYSENGMHGSKGMITDFIKKRIDDFKEYDIYCCGPVEMYKALQNIFCLKNIRAKALFEEIMACGIGVCKGCVMKFKDNQNGYIYKSVCKDGPLFDLSEAVFEQ
ncbi:MAG: dihydroorotate dehydrogenase electron transfer subunit [Actinomycetota bacterium]|nr:dihydroorotate dehydrogenase electron transfer subunit [Actinomycetota bacterium]